MCIMYMLLLLHILLLQTAALRFLRVCIECGECYTHYFIQHRLLWPVVKLLRDVNGINNILDNAVLATLHTVR
jgi:hypothetical protein